MPKQNSSPLFFPTPAAFRAWLDAHHAGAHELWVGYYKRDSGKPSITWPESVAQALCFGWIDGLRKSIDDSRYMIRFTPRKPTSHWSAINVAMVEKLTKEGQMTPAGLAAFAKRRPERDAPYSYEAPHEATLSTKELALFKKQRAAWAHFGTQAPSYQRAVIRWITSAKKPETRARRLATLIRDSQSQQKVAPMRVTKTKPAKR